MLERGEQVVVDAEACWRVVRNIESFQSTCHWIRREKVLGYGEMLAVWL